MKKKIPRIIKVANACMIAAFVNVLLIILIALVAIWFDLWDRTTPMLLIQQQSAFAVLFGTIGGGIYFAAIMFEVD